MQKIEEGSRTQENLQMAFAGSAMARTRWEILAGQARQEGQTGLAGLYRELADENGRQAEMWYRGLEGEEGEMQEHLREMAETERMQAEEILPEFAETAAKEGYKEIEADLKQAADAAKKREEALKSAFLAE